MKRREFLNLIGIGAGMLALPGMPKKKVENLGPFVTRPDGTLKPKPNMSEEIVTIYERPKIQHVELQDEYGNTIHKMEFEVRGSYPDYKGSKRVK